MKTAHVIGLGRSGIAAARVLARQQWQVTLSDRDAATRHQADALALQAEGITIKLNHSFTPAPGLDLLVVSPGVPWDAPALVAARAQGTETIGEMELAWRSLSHLPWLGITGTNGKTTTTALVAAIFKAAGLQAPACGNIGYAACELALTEPPDWIIAELSSYQIEAAPTLKPTIGLWTTFTADHLSRHKTVENYSRIKASLLANSQIAVINGDDPYLLSKAAAHAPSSHWTCTKGKDAILPLVPDTYIENGWVIHAGEQIVETEALRMVGAHNQQNLLMAVAAARFAGIEASAIAQGVSTFPGVSHRLEHICTWRGVDFINDSKATNYDAAEVGLRSVAGPAILIAGGDPKDGDDTAWVRQIEAKAIAVLLIGAAAEPFADRLKAAAYPHYEVVQTMDRAVARSAEISKQQPVKTVLLSPACASFDQYANFEVRGDDFRQVCTKYLGEM
ncbi:MAG: UDP-N-acetylmuramoyl-L-alanine--D-glutamate ligase [Phormidesmis priestleyi]|uniref:UDP-N-acetylmuramoylalanine--D-glutamate ligase n=1 Tax=Phormidesmis priestleyi TaxID=268141 RepID=A0A2W4WNL4_9CYAN|nr:MAG: UDP-N-acetylmuramoyl-L-alanine--D-glutamate ligase [Phormidesmis priestleyi]